MLTSCCVLMFASMKESAETRRQRMKERKYVYNSLVGWFSDGRRNHKNSTEPFFSLSFALFLCEHATMKTIFALRFWWMEKEVHRRFMGISIFTVSNLLLLHSHIHSCLFVENGCFYYWSRELPNCICCCFCFGMFGCMLCCDVLVCSQQRGKIKHLIQ